MLPRRPCSVEGDQRRQILRWRSKPTGYFLDGNWAQIWGGPCLRRRARYVEPSSAAINNHNKRSRLERHYIIQDFDNCGAFERVWASDFFVAAGQGRESFGEDTSVTENHAIGHRIRTAVSGLHGLDG